jgi:hypothetical protein
MTTSKNLTLHIAQIIYCLSATAVIIGLFLIFSALWYHAPISFELFSVGVVIFLGAISFISIALTFYRQTVGWINTGKFPKTRDLYSLVVKGLALNVLTITLITFGKLGLLALPLVLLVVYVLAIMLPVWKLSEHLIHFLFVGKLEKRKG